MDKHVEIIKTLNSTIQNRDKVISDFFNAEKVHQDCVKNMNVRIAQLQKALREKEGSEKGQRIGEQNGKGSPSQDFPKVDACDINGFIWNY